MLHKIISTFGLGILGIDPITAVYLLSMGLRKEKKSRISLFFLSFAGFSVFIGAVLAAVFGVAAVDLLKSVTPEDDSPFWAVLEFGISVFILVWVLRKLFCQRREPAENKEEAISGSWFQYLTTGFVFAVTSFTDPTYYAVILMGGETGNFLTSVLLLSIWFLVSQFMAVVIYIANSVNALNKLVMLVDEWKEKKLKSMTMLFYILLLAIAIGLIADSGFYLFTGNYLF